MSAARLIEHLIITAVKLRSVWTLRSVPVWKQPRIQAQTETTFTIWPTESFVCGWEEMKVSEISSGYETFEMTPCMKVETEEQAHGGASCEQQQIVCNPVEWLKGDSEIQCSKASQQLLITSNHQTFTLHSTPSAIWSSCTAPIHWVATLKANDHIQRREQKTRHFTVTQCWIYKVPTVNQMSGVTLTSDGFTFLLEWNSVFRITVWSMTQTLTRTEQ